MLRASSFVCAALLIAACSSSKSSNSSGSGAGGTLATSTAGGTTGAGGTLADAGPDAPVIPPPDGSIGDPCALAGTLQFTSNGTVTVPGGSTTAPSLSFLHLPVGFCAHYYGTVPNARQLRFSPGSMDLFVASPISLTTGGGVGGLSAIVILPDANQDGNADATITYLSGLPSTQGLLFANNFFYYQGGPPGSFVGPFGNEPTYGTQILRVPYTPGDHTPGAASEVVADITYWSDDLHWPKTLDMADDGTIYVGNGGDQAETCIEPHPAHGAIVTIDPAPGGANPGGTVVAQGLRNPINVRCLKGHNTCFALELAKDYTDGTGGREKLIHIHQGDDWGFPCCATQNLPYYQTLTQNSTVPNCSTVAAETNSFVIGDTPFGLDFEMGLWSGTYAGRAFVATHGAASTWVGTRIVAIPMDPSTGLPTATTDLDDGGLPGPDTGGMVDFATGWYDATPGANVYGRPAALAFHPDGRLFVANDSNGIIFWIAQMAQ
jgi:glucose/arabinose dehydrogenase